MFIRQRLWLIGEAPGLEALAPTVSRGLWLTLVVVGLSCVFPVWLASVQLGRLCLVQVRSIKVVLVEVQLSWAQLGML